MSVAGASPDAGDPVEVTPDLPTPGSVREETATIPDGPVGLAELFGGPRGLIDAGLPGLVFALAYPISGSNLTLSIWLAVACGVVLCGVNLVQGRKVQQAIAGLVGVGLMAFFAARSGRAQDFYLPSLIKNGAYAAAYAISIVVRWPLLGVFLGPILGEGFAWRSDPARLRAYSRATWVWVAMFAVRLAVQIPLYLAGAVTALGFANIPLGYPLFALTGWLTYLILKRTPRTVPPETLEAVPESVPGSEPDQADGASNS